MDTGVWNKCCHVDTILWPSRLWGMRGAGAQVMLPFPLLLHPLQDLGDI